MVGLLRTFQSLGALCGQWCLMPYSWSYEDFGCLWILSKRSVFVSNRRQRRAGTQRSDRPRPFAEWWRMLTLMQTRWSRKRIRRSFALFLIRFRCNRCKGLAIRKAEFGEHFNKCQNATGRQTTPRKCSPFDLLEFRLRFKCNRYKWLAIGKYLQSTSTDAGILMVATLLAWKHILRFLAISRSTQM
jgi:hypothetical protein